MEKLKVGDVLYVTYYSTFQKYVIERVTEKTAFSGHRKFKIEPDKRGAYDIIGPDKFGPFSGKKENDEIRKWLKRKEYAALIESVQKKFSFLPDHITTEDIQARIDMIEKFSSEFTQLK